MDNDAVQIALPDYKVSFTCEKIPRLKVTIGKRTGPELERMVSELPQGEPKTVLEFSTDDLFPDDHGVKLSVVVSVIAKVTPHVRSLTGCSTNIPLVCCIGSIHPKKMANNFFENCQTYLKMNEGIPIIVLGHNKKVLCVLHASEITRFSWAEKMREFHIDHEKTTNYSLN